MKIVMYFLSSLVLLSCTGNESFKKQTFVVDSLQVVVDDLKLRMDSIDAEEMNEVSEESKDLYNYFTENYKDSANREFWISDMNALRQVMKIMIRHQENYNKTMEDLQYTEKQLQDLKNSMEDGKIDKEKADQYLQDEAEAVNELKMQVQKSQPLVLSALNTWDTLHPKMAAMADSLKTSE